MVRVFTDGSCMNNGTHKGIGGWAYYLRSYNEAVELEIEEYNGALETTSNRMEIEAVIKALEKIITLSHLISKKFIRFYCDSNLVVQTLCKNSTFKQKKNQDLWKEANKHLKTLRDKGYDVDFIWVKSHTNIESDIYEGNRKVDKLAGKAKDMIMNDISIFM